jgi:hypothetical protein
MIRIRQQSCKMTKPNTFVSGFVILKIQIPKCFIKNLEFN